ncbi:hypothetical protein V8043_004374 [Vibrio vulnificus]
MLQIMNGWLSEQDFSEEATSMFEESLGAYHAGLWRSSLLMGYLGFVIVAKDRILGASCPNGITTGQWNKIQKDLRDATGWDSASFDAIRMKAPASIFLLTDDVRHQIEYWKNRRNDCAHSKPNIISSSHVEAFYYFLLSNMSKLAVNGSKASFIQMVKDHYDLRMTPSHISVNEVSKKISTYIEPSELNEVFCNLFDHFDSNRTTYEKTTNQTSADKIDFCNSIYKVANTASKKELTLLLEKDLNLYVEVLRENTTLVGNLRGKTKLIRQVWTSYAFKSGKNDMSLIVSLLNAKLIPVSEHQELFARLVKQDSHCQPTSVELNALKMFGYYRYIEALIDNDLFNNFDKSNSLRHQIVSYISNVTIDKKLAEAIFNGFNSSLHPFDLRNSLNLMFNNNKAKVSEYKSHNLGQPKGLSSLK